ncbi:hypothetical protein HK102_013673 [Quaeritorhiza haematococci]|nr:hypothetical protein HK102_013673 [Quaeritorhiza haematococci]
MATASRDRLIHVFDVNRLELIQTLDDHSSSITAIRFAEDGRRLISCAADKSIVFRQMADPMDDPEYITYHNSTGRSTVYDMDIESSHKYIATVAQDRRLNVFSVNTGKPIRSYRPDPVEDPGLENGSGGGFIKVSMDPAGLYAATSASDKCIRVFDFYTGVCVARVVGHSELITSVKFTQDCSRLISTGGDGCIFVWKVAPQLTQHMRKRLRELRGEAESPQRVESSPEAILPSSSQRSAVPATPGSVSYAVVSQQEFGFPAFDETGVDTVSTIIDGGRSSLSSQYSNSSTNQNNMTSGRLHAAWVFKEDGLPAWARTSREESNVTSGMIEKEKPPLPTRGRWAQRVDEKGITLFSELPGVDRPVAKMDDLFNRRFSIEIPPDSELLAKVAPSGDDVKGTSDEFQKNPNAGSITPNSSDKNEASGKVAVQPVSETPAEASSAEAGSKLATTIDSASTLSQELSEPSNTEVVGDTLDGEDDIDTDPIVEDITDREDEQDEPIFLDSVDTDDVDPNASTFVIGEEKPTVKSGGKGTPAAEKAVARTGTEKDGAPSENSQLSGSASDLSTKKIGDGKEHSSDEENADSTPADVLDGDNTDGDDDVELEGEFSKKEFGQMTFDEYLQQPIDLSPKLDVRRSISAKHLAARKSGVLRGTKLLDFLFSKGQSNDDEHSFDDDPDKDGLEQEQPTEPTDAAKAKVLPKPISTAPEPVVNAPEPVPQAVTNVSSEPSSTTSTLSFHSMVESPGLPIVLSSPNFEERVAGQLPQQSAPVRGDKTTGWQQRKAATAKEVEKVRQKLAAMGIVWKSESGSAEGRLDESGAESDLWSSVQSHGQTNEDRSSATDIDLDTRGGDCAKPKDWSVSHLGDLKSDDETDNESSIAASRESVTKTRGGDTRSEVEFDSHEDSASTALRDSVMDTLNAIQAIADRACKSLVHLSTGREEHQSTSSVISPTTRKMLMDLRTELETAHRNLGQILETSEESSEKSRQSTSDGSGRDVRKLVHKSTPTLTKEDMKSILETYSNLLVGMVRDKLHA